MKKVLTVVALSIGLAGCAHQASPNYYYGNYYMAGDDNCRSMQLVEPSTIMCMDAEGSGTGYRQAMSQDDVQIYQMQQTNQQMQMAQLSQQLQQTGQSFQNTGQQILQQSQSYSAPQVQPYSSGSGTTSYSQVGSSLVGTDGSSCHYVGSTIICR